MSKDNTPEPQEIATRYRIKTYITVIAACFVVVIISLAVRHFSEKALPENTESAAVAEAVRESSPPSSKTDALAQDKASGGEMRTVQMNVVKDGKFKAVGEAPRSAVDVLNDMAEGRDNPRKGKNAIKMNEKDLNRKISFGGASEPVSLQGSIPGSESGKAMITAPVSVKLFREENSYAEFVKTHTGNFPKADFSADMVVMLVSMSHLPNRIFEIKEVIPQPKRLLVRYGINPLAASGPGDDSYSAAVSPMSDLPVELEQVP